MKFDPKILTLGAVIALGGCAVAPRTFTVSQNYEKLASCFYRAAKRTISHGWYSGDKLSLTRLTDPNEIDISDEVHSMWSGNQWAWGVHFIEKTPELTNISASSLVSYAYTNKNIRRINACVRSDTH